MVLVAHSLGCLAATSWAACRQPNIRGVFLVAPPDPAGPNFPAAATTFTSPGPAPLDVPGLIICSEGDPFCATDIGIRLAAALQLDRVSAGLVGYINSAGRLGRWDLAYTPSEGGILTKTVLTDAKGRTNTTEHAPGRGSTTAVVDVAGRRTDAVYDALGRPTSVWKPGQIKDATQATTTYAYLQRTDGPLAVTTKSLVDYETGTNYVTSISLYDAFGQVRQVQTDTIGGGRVASDTVYDSHGWVRWTNNRYMTTGAPATNLISVAGDAVDDRTAIAYDNAGRPIKQTAYKGQSPTRDTKTIYGGDRVTTIPPAGDVTTTVITNIRGKATELRQYTSPPTITGDVVSGGTHHATTYRYTALGQLDKVTDAVSNTWTYGYDFLGRKVTQTDPDAGTSTSTYDVAGQLLTTTDARNQTIAYEYDVLGRKITEYSGSLTGTKLASWTWDTARNGVGKLHYSTRYTSSGNYFTGVGVYDGQGNPNTYFVSIPSSETGLAGFHTTTYAYTTTGQLKGFEPAVIGGGLPGNDIMSIGLDKLGRPLSMLGYNAYVSSTSYTDFGEPSQYTLGPSNNTAKLTYNYDAQTRRLVGTTLSAQQALPQIDDIQYTYDPAGNITRAINTQGHPGAPDTRVRTECFGYDALRRLDQAWTATDNCAASAGLSTIGGPTPYWTSWTFDPIGQRTKQVQHTLTGDIPDTTTTYTYPTPGTARPHALSGTTTTGPAGTSTTGYDYNQAGSTIARNLPSGSQTLTWDEWNRLSTVESLGGSTKYVYDADGTQLIRRDPNKTTLFLPGQELTRDNTTGTLTGTRYYSFNGTTVALRVGGANPKYVATGLHGTMSATADSVGFAVTRRTMDPYGNPLGGIDGGPWPTTRGFLNMPTSDTTGLTDIGARKYDATTGRFISVDPVMDPADPQQMHGYAYANNNPTAFSDPSGLWLEGGVDNKGITYGVSNGSNGSQIPIGNSKAINGEGTGGGHWEDGPRDNSRWVEEPQKQRAQKRIGHTLIEADSWYLWAEGWQEAMKQYKEGGFSDLPDYCVNLDSQPGMCHAYQFLDLGKFQDYFCAQPGIRCPETGDGLGTALADGVDQGMFGGGSAAGGVRGLGAGNSGGSKTGCSFLPGTQVLMADGTRKPIEDLQAGDMVLATEPETGDTRPEAILARCPTRARKTSSKSP